ncbi:papain-like cysteine protease family protein [Streptomyces sp. NPDC093982]|uniref:papain-like cysteine protease family protein n=1 Tax=Streptomyces sp. NPDC093982 TaxID=3155077 RepID=UPI00341D3115
MKALLAAICATLSVAFGLTMLNQAQATVAGTLFGGQGKYSYINHRSQASISSNAVGRSSPGEQILMTCKTTGTPVENNPWWIYTGSYYIAAAFVTENIDSVPSCSDKTRQVTTPNTRVIGAGSQKRVPINMQKQVQNQWCWDASGLTIAKYWGFTGYNQRDFCRLAATGRWVDCNNRPATLEDMANGLARMGIASSGNSMGRPSFAEVTRQIDAGRPFGVRFGWHSGGGHMNVIYGYDRGSNMIAVGDPWPNTQTYTWWNYNSYSNNSRFEWTHSRINIHN